MTITALIVPALIAATGLAPAPRAAEPALITHPMWVPASQVEIDGVATPHTTGMVRMVPGTPAVPGRCDDTNGSTDLDGAAG